MGPYTAAASVTKADANLADGLTRGLWVGGAGNVVVKMQSGQIVTFTAVPAGTELPIKVTQVRNATTATAILALY